MLALSRFYLLTKTINKTNNDNYTSYSNWSVFSRFFLLASTALSASLKLLMTQRARAFTRGRCGLVWSGVVWSGLYFIRYSYKPKLRFVCDL